MVQLLFVLSALGSYVVVMSDQVNLTATIPPGYALQDYLCSGPLESNTTLVLGDGEHRISSGPPCNISNGGNITIAGSAMKNTTVLCEGEGRVFVFISAQTLSTERITFINCGLHLISIENILITECTFQDRSNTAIYSYSLNHTSITIANCLFVGNNGDVGGAVFLQLQTGDVKISNCTFQNNSARYGGGGGVLLYLSTGDVSITNCTFQNNSAPYRGGGVSLYLPTGDVSITNCTFQNNSARYGSGGGMSLDLSTSDVSITNTTFQNSAASGGGVSYSNSIGNVIITNCIFQNNSATMNLAGGGGVLLYRYKGKVSITNSGFQGNRVINIGGGVSVQISTSDVTIKNCTFQKNSVIAGQDAGIVYALTGDVSITDCTFQNNSVSDGDNSAGGVVTLYGIKGNASITNCTFQNNWALLAVLCHGLGYRVIFKVV